MAIAKKKISLLPLATTLKGLFTIGVDNNNKSCKVGLEFVQDAADAATNAASTAATAAQTVDSKIDAKLDSRVPASGAENRLLAKGPAGESNRWVDARVTGATCRNGHYKSTDPRLFFNGRKTVAVVFTTSADFNDLNAANVVQTLVLFATSGFGAVCRLDRIFVQSPVTHGYLGAFFSSVQPNTTYLFIYTIDDLGQLNVWCNDIQIVRNYLLSDIEANNVFRIGGQSDGDATQFPGTIHSVRLWNHLLPQADMEMLWNNAHPESAVMPSRMYGGSSALVGEFLPWGVSATGWRNNAVAGLDMGVVKTPEVSYTACGSPTDVIIDTGIFYTDIAEGVSTKTIPLIMGYVPVFIELMSYAQGTASHTGVKVAVSWTGRNLIDGGSIGDGRRRLFWAGGSMFASTGAFTASGVSLQEKASGSMDVNATGNSVSTGLRVKIGMKYTGTGPY